MVLMMLAWEYPPRVVGGLARHVHDISHALSSKAEVHVITCAHEKTESGYDGAVRVHRVAPIGPATDDFVKWVMQLGFSMLGKAMEIASSTGGVDIVHAHDWLAAYPGVAAKHALGVPLIATIHATEWGRNNGLHNPVQRHISDIEWFLCYEAWRVIVCSRHMQSELTGVFGVPSDKIRVIPNGVVASRFIGDSAHPDLFPAEDTIAYVGRLVNEKGVHLLIEALPKILHYWPKAKLVIAGTGPAEGHLRDLVSRLGLEGKVAIMGFVDDAKRNAIYRHAKVAVVPSLYEPFGITALEAMASGTPVVVSDTGGLAEIIDHGTDGWKFYTGNVNSLADAVLHLLHCPTLADKLGREGQRKVRDIYDWDRIADATLDAYSQVLAHAENSRGGYFNEGSDNGRGQRHQASATHMRSS